MGQFLYDQDPGTRKIMSLEKIKLKLINKQYSIVFNKTCFDNNLLAKYTLLKKGYVFLKECINIVWKNNYRYNMSTVKNFLD